MSTIVRSSSESRGGRADDALREAGDRRADPGSRESRRPLSGRALRVRNACVCRAAVQLGLAMPADADLLDIPGDASLGEAVDWWRARAPGTVEVVGSAARVSLVMRTVVVMAVTLVGLVVSYGRVQ
jgi:hypothetical protein